MTTQKVKSKNKSQKNNILKTPDCQAAKITCHRQTSDHGIVKDEYASLLEDLYKTQ